MSIFTKAVRFPVRAFGHYLFIILNENISYALPFQSVKKFIIRKKHGLYHQLTSVVQHFPNFVAELFEPELKITAAVTIMTGAVLSLLANIVMLSLVAVLRRLQRPQNAFIIHQLVIDIVKSVHVILFAKVSGIQRIQPF